MTKNSFCLNSPGVKFQHHLLPGELFERGISSGGKLFLQCYLSLLTKQNSDQTVAKLSLLGQATIPKVYAMSTLQSHSISREGAIFWCRCRQGELIERGRYSRAGDLLAEIRYSSLSLSLPFFQVRNEFYQETKIAILVYDVNSKKTFEALEDWLAELSHNIDGNHLKNTVIGVCCNKVRHF